MTHTLSRLDARATDHKLYTCAQMFIFMLSCMYIYTYTHSLTRTRTCTIYLTFNAPTEKDLKKMMGLGLTREQVVERAMLDKELVQKHTGKVCVYIYVYICRFMCTCI